MPPEESGYTCPRCGQPVRRTHRLFLDRVASLAVPLRRFKCRNCGWTGLRISSHSLWVQHPRVMLMRVALIVLVLLAAVLIAVHLRF
jgi:predicted RNA-binding Zn-ribbon protein involved in translation (DUF1610 family)